MQNIDKELQKWSTIEPTGIRTYKLVKSNISDKDKIYELTIEQNLTSVPTSNSQPNDKQIKVTKLFCIFSVDDTKVNESGNLYRLQKTIDLIEHEFVQESEKAIRELLNYF